MYEKEIVCERELESEVCACVCLRECERETVCLCH